jgi:hypothetical protein
MTTSTDTTQIHRSSSLPKLWLLILCFYAALQPILAQRGKGLDASLLLQTEVQLEFKNALWLDSSEHCFLSLVLFQENKEEEEVIEDLQLHWDQYTEVIHGVKLKFEEEFMDPLIYHHYSDSLGSYMQALFLCDDFDAAPSDSLTLDIATMSGYARQSQAFFFNTTKAIPMPEMDETCSSSPTNRRWLKAWLKVHPEMRGSLVRQH